MKNVLKTLALVAIGVAVGRVSHKFVEVEFYPVDSDGNKISKGKSMLNPYS